MKKLTIIVLILLIINASAHSGRTDKNGGHHDRKNGGYHYHNGGPSVKKKEYVPPKQPVDDYKKKAEQKKEALKLLKIEEHSKAIKMVKENYTSLKGYSEALWDMIEIDKLLKKNLKPDAYLEINNLIIKKAKTIKKNKDEFKTRKQEELTQVDNKISKIELENKRLSIWSRQVIVTARNNFKELFKEKLGPKIRAEIIKANPDKKADEGFIASELETRKKEALKEVISKAFDEREKHEKLYQENLDSIKNLTSEKVKLQSILEE